MDVLDTREKLALYEQFVKLGEASSVKSSIHRLTPWIPARYCEDDWILSLRVYRYSRSRFEIALFVAEEHYQFRAYAGVIGGLIFSLSDAYFHTGKMEIHFVGPDSGERPSVRTGCETAIPEAIAEVARTVGVRFENRDRISDLEGRALYCALSGLNIRLTARLHQLKIDPVQTAFLLNRSIWTPEQMDVILHWATSPKEILWGNLNPESWLQFQSSLALLRYVILGDRIRNVLETEAGLDPRLFSYKWHSPAELRICSRQSMSILDDFGLPIRLADPKEFVVFLLPREVGIAGNLISLDLVSLKASKADCVVVSADYAKSHYCRQLVSGVKPAPAIKSITDSLTDLDGEIMRKLMQTASTRRAVEERSD